MNIEHYVYLLFWVLTKAKKNNCVVRVTAEKTLGRVGRFLFFFAMAHMLDDKKGFLAENNLEFQSPELCCVFTFWPEDIQLNTDRIHYFNAEMGGKNTKNRVIEVANARLYDLPEMTETTIPVLPNCTEPYR